MRKFDWAAKLRFCKGSQAAYNGVLRSLWQFIDYPSYAARTALVICIITLFILPLAAREIFPVPKLPFQPLSYTCHYTDGAIKLDGKLEEADWQAASWTADFVDIEGDMKPQPFHRTRIKMLWDNQGLYIAAELEEPHIWASLTERDAVIFHDNDFEVFIDPDGDTHDYYELELNALGTLWDLFLLKPYRDRQQVAVNAWDIRGIEYGIDLKGTLNDPSDTDHSWTVEMLLPWKILSECAHKPVPPDEGDYWRMNFSRVQWETDVIDGNYLKKPGRPEYNWVWSPQGLIAMHYPERWGFVFFTKQTVGKNIESAIPETEYAKEYLRQLYYRQKQYWFDHGSYATSLKQLNAQPFLFRGKKLKPRIETTSESYVLTLKLTPEMLQIQIREDGITYIKEIGKD